MTRLEKILELDEVPLLPEDFAALRREYGAVKHGTHDFNTYALGASPSYRLAAQIDLDRFHEGKEHHLFWDDLIEEMFPEKPEYANLQEKIEDEFAAADGRC